MTRKLFHILVLLLMVTQGAWAQSTVYVSTYAELSAAIANASVNKIIVTADINVPCETSGNAGSTDMTGASTAQLVITRSLTLQSQAGSTFVIKRVAANGANSSALKSLIAIRGNGNGTSGTANLTENTVEVSFTNIIIDGGANWGSTSVQNRYSAAADACGYSGRATIDIYLGATLNLEDGVEVRNGFTTKSDNSLLNDASSSQCFGGAIRVDYHNNTGGGTINIKAGASIHDCTARGGYGGALGAYNYARLNLYGGTIDNCSAANGGAIACTYRSATGYGSTTAGSIRMYGGTISNCHANNGGAFLMHGESVDDYFLGGTITGCSATNGGVMYVGENNSSPNVHLVEKSSGWLTFSSCSNTNATATASTGGYDYIYLNKGTISETPVCQVTFRNNNTDFAVLHVLQGNSLGEAFPAAPVNANFRFVGWYNGDAQVTSSTAINDNITVTAQWDFLGSGSSTDPYLIPSADVWDFLADQVNAGNSYSSEYFRLTADISVTQAVGTFTRTPESYNAFSGTFDGDGHTLTINMSNQSRFGAPFKCVSGATIKNLCVRGTINGSGNSDGKLLAGIVGVSYGSTTITNCRSSVTLTTNYGNDAAMAGIVAATKGGSLTITGCVFDGSMTGGTSNTRCAGIAGYEYNATTTTISNTVFAPSTLNVSTADDTYTKTFSRDADATITNCYYTIILGTAQGKYARTISAGDDVTISGLGVASATYDVSGITAYAHGINYGGTYYAGSGDEVSLTLSHGDKAGYTFNQYTVTGGGTLANPTTNSPTLTMTDADQTIGAGWLKNVASVTTSGDVTTYYTTFSDALAAWESNSTLKLLTSVETASTITVSATSILDLNGFGIKMTGTGPVIRVGASKTFTLNDSNPTATHKFSVTDNLATLDEENGTLTIYGGYITGGRDSYGSAIDVSNNNASHFIMNAGTLIGNNNGSGDNLGTVCVARDSKEFYNSFTMNGGAICYNNAVGIGVLPVGTANINGGKIHHNNGAGIRMWRSQLLSLNNAEITDNTASGILVDAREAAIQVQGRTIITNNALSGNPADINYDRGDNNRTRPLAIVGALHSEARIGIYYNPTDSYSAIGSAFTSGLSGNGNASNFFSNLDGYRVNINASGEALLTEEMVTLNQETDNSSFISTNNGLVYDVTLTRTLQIGGWNTFCVPFNISSSQIESIFGEGTKVRELGSSAFDVTTKTLTLNFTNAPEIEAGKPYLVYLGSASNVANPTFEDVTIVNGTTTTETTYANFVPVMNPTELPGGDKTVLFVTAGNKLTYPNKSANLNGFRAYFKLKEGAAANASAFEMNFDEGETTGISSIENGQWTIDNSEVYNLNGQRVAQPTKGLYIVNGKKMIVK